MEDKNTYDIDENDLQDFDEYLKYYKLEDGIETEDGDPIELDFN